MSALTFEIATRLKGKTKADKIVRVRMALLTFNPEPQLKKVSTAVYKLSRINLIEGFYRVVFSNSDSVLYSAVLLKAFKSDFSLTLSGD